MTDRRDPTLGTWLKRLYVNVAWALIIYLAIRERELVADLVQLDRAWLLIAPVLMGLGLFVINAWFWQAAIRGLWPQSAASNADLSLRRITRLNAVAVPSRYLPGSVWYAAGRATVLAKDGVPKRVVAAVSFLESAVIVSVGGVVGLAILYVAGSLRQVWVLAPAAILLAASTPPALALAWKFVQRLRKAPSPTELSLSWGTWALLCAIQVIHRLLFAVTFWIYLVAVGAAAAPFAVIVGGVFVGWSVGFLAIFAPQGLGVFEATLAGIVGSGDLAATTVVFAGARIVILLRDALGFLLAGGLRGESLITHDTSDAEGSAPQEDATNTSA